MVPKIPRCTVDILNDILPAKTEDVGKHCGLPPQKKNRENS
jgi:hypothetical protein